MSRLTLVTMPTDPSQFGPAQVKPRALLGLAMSGLSAWLDEHLKVSYSHLLTRHRTGFVFTNVHLDRAAIAQAATPLSGRPLGTQATTTVALTRSHCEVADQWSYPELMELLATAREHVFLDDSIPAEIGKLAVAAPIRSMAAVFQRAMYVFDSCHIITRAYALPEQQDAVMFGHEVHDPAHPGQCLTAWEILKPV